MEVVGGGLAMVDADLVEREGEAALRAVDHRHLGAARLAEDRGGDADRAGADDQDAMLRADLGTLDAMRADGEELDHGGLVDGQAVGRHDMALRHGDELAGAAVAMHAQHLQTLAAIGAAHAAGPALPAIEIGLDRDDAAGDEGAAGGRRHDLAAELVADDPRIVEIGLVAVEDMIVGAANADPADADEHVAGAGHRLVALDDGEAARLVAA